MEHKIEPRGLLEFSQFSHQFRLHIDISAVMLLWFEFPLWSLLNAYDAFIEDHVRPAKRLYFPLTKPTTNQNSVPKLFVHRTHLPEVTQFLVFKRYGLFHGIRWCIGR